jgi:hypothetical protein
MNDDPVVTDREYLMDACFGVILTGDRVMLERIHGALGDPVWFVWFGRKSCIPAAPIPRGLFSTEVEACAALVGNTPRESLTQVAEAVFPTRVGMVRERHLRKSTRRCFPHAREGWPQCKIEMNWPWNGSGVPVERP